MYQTCSIHFSLSLQELTSNCLWDCVMGESEPPDIPLFAGGICGEHGCQCAPGLSLVPHVLWPDNLGDGLALQNILSQGP